MRLMGSSFGCYRTLMVWDIQVYVLDRLSALHGQDM